MPTIEVSDETYKHIQDIKRQYIENTGYPISDEDAVDMSTFFTLICNVQPVYKWFDAYMGAVAKIKLKRNQFDEEV